MAQDPRPVGPAFGLGPHERRRGRECGGIDQDFLTSTSASNSTSSQAATTAPRPVTSAVGTCRSGPSTLCLLDRRFAVEVDWRNPGNNTSGVGGAGALSNITGTFTFAAISPGRPIRMSS